MLALHQEGAEHLSKHGISYPGNDPKKRAAFSDVLRYNPLGRMDNSLPKKRDDSMPISGLIILAGLVSLGWELRVFEKRRLAQNRHCGSLRLRQHRVSEVDELSRVMVRPS
jgi:hypothetical protein